MRIFVQIIHINLEKLPAWKQKRLDALKRRQGKKTAGEPEKASEEDKKILEELTSFVDQLARNGYYDIYTDSFEKIKFKLKKMDEKVEDGKFKVLEILSCQLKFQMTLICLATHPKTVLTQVKTF